MFYVNFLHCHWLVESTVSLHYRWKFVMQQFHGFRVLMIIRKWTIIFFRQWIHLPKSIEIYWLDQISPINNHRSRETFRMKHYEDQISNWQSNLEFTEFAIETRKKQLALKTWKMCFGFSERNVLLPARMNLS